MAPSREIEKLQRRWQENPLGLTFAPLAEAYRKEGLFAEALDLLDIGLAQHPNYVPAHIVRGRCYLDAREDGNAELAFRIVLDLDPENVIALKSLAEIAERGGRFDESAGHLDRLLAFDRHNDDALAQLDRLRSLTSMPSPGAIDPDPVVLSAAAPGPAIVEEPVGTPAPEPAPEPEPVVESEPAVESEPVVEAEPVVALTDADLDPWRPPAVAEPPALADLDDADAGETEEEEAPAVTAEIVDNATGEIDVVLFHPVELTAGDPSEFQVSSDSESLSPRAGESDPYHGYSTDEPPAPATPELEPEAESAEVALDADAMLTPATEPDAGFPDQPPAESAEPRTVEPAAGDDEPELVVTESMAEVFLRQGHRELALAVYTQLGAKEPDNVRVREARASLESELRTSGGPGSLPVYAAALTGGQSVRAFLDGLLAAGRPGEADLGPSLGSVFGNEAGPAPAAADPGEAGPSYDEFFGDQTSESVPAPERAGAAASESEDIEEFNAWLRGLKR